MMEEGGPSLVLLALLRSNGRGRFTGEDVEAASAALLAEDDPEDAPRIRWRIVSAPYVAPDGAGGVKAVPAVYEVWLAGA